MGICRYAPERRRASLPASRVGHTILSAERFSFQYSNAHTHMPHVTLAGSGGKRQKAGGDAPDAPQRANGTAAAAGGSAGGVEGAQPVQEHQAADGQSPPASAPASAAVLAGVAAAGSAALATSPGVPETAVCSLGIDADWLLRQVTGNGEDVDSGMASVGGGAAAASV